MSARQISDAETARQIVEEHKREWIRVPQRTGTEANDAIEGSIGSTCVAGIEPRCAGRALCCCRYLVTRGVASAPDDEQHQCGSNSLVA